MQTDDKQRLALVTGTSRGIGAAIAAGLLERGWEVLGIARGEAPEGLDHERYTHARLDLSDLPAAGAWLEEHVTFRDAPGARLAVINNAGTLRPMGPVTKLPADELVASLTVNVAAPLWLAGFALRTARAASVRVVDLSSGAATSAYPGWAAYCAGKAALLMGGKVLHTELQEVADLRGRDVRLLSYAPHVVATGMQAEIRDMAAEDFPRLARFQGLHEEGQLVAPEGPAEEICALLESDDLPQWSERRFTP